MTLTQIMARTTWVAHAFEWGKLLKCHLKEKTSRKLANGQNIDYSEKKKKKITQGCHLPGTGVKYHIDCWLKKVLLPPPPREFCRHSLS